MSQKSTDSLQKKSPKSSINSGSIPKLIGSQSSYEEGGYTNYDDFLPESDLHKLPPKTKEYYYQDYKYVKPTQSGFDRKQVKGSKLFDKTKKIVQEEEHLSIEDEKLQRDASILVSGFGMRNVDSFQRLIKMSQEERRKWELRKLWRDEQVKLSISRDQERLEKVQADLTARTETSDVSTSTDSRTRRSSSDFLTQTETTRSALADQKKHLDYLLGLEQAMEESVSTVDLGVTETVSEDEFKYSTSKSIREAQRYLRVHRIFECFQFIVAQLLSASAENPIEFILNLLNKCLLYRSGMGEPPLLYEKKHINQLFNLMDRLHSGYIDMPQYVTGMNTLGICTYNENPERNDDGQINRETFTEEAYEAELAIFNDLIRRHPEKSKIREKKIPPGFDSVSLPSLNPPFFIPSDLFKFSKHKFEVFDKYDG